MMNGMNCDLQEKIFNSFSSPKPNIQIFHSIKCLILSEQVLEFHFNLW